MQIKVLFLIHDLGRGGAEKVLVNLANNMDRTKFKISVLALFGGGVNEKFLAPDIHYCAIFKKTFPGNSKLMTLFTPGLLHKLFIKEQYDIEVSYLEGPAARIISGCNNPNTKLVSWIHSRQFTISNLSRPFRSKKEAVNCYSRFDQTVCVSNGIINDFCSILDIHRPCQVLYNTVDSDAIRDQKDEQAERLVSDGKVRLISVGALKEVKGFIRLLNIIHKLVLEGRKVHLYILGEGHLRPTLEAFIKEYSLGDSITLLGYEINPYKYVSKCDLFICSSYSEGFSTAVTEALIVGTPVCSVDVSGMKELLGENNEYGVITENNENALLEGIKRLVDSPELLLHYRQQAEIRGRKFDMTTTVKAVEQLFLSIFSTINSSLVL